MLLVYVDAAIGRNSLHRGPTLAEAGRYFPMEHTRFSNRQLRVDTAHIRTGVELGRIRAGQFPMNAPVGGTYIEALTLPLVAGEGDIDTTVRGFAFHLAAQAGQRYATVNSIEGDS